MRQEEQSSLVRPVLNPNTEHGSLKLAEGEGFEPPEPCGSPVFKTGSLNHSDTPPKSTGSSIGEGAARFKPSVRVSEQQFYHHPPFAGSWFTV